MSIDETNRFRVLRRKEDAPHKNGRLSLLETKELSGLNIRYIKARREKKSSTNPRLLNTWQLENKQYLKGVAKDTNLSISKLNLKNKKVDKAQIPSTSPRLEPLTIGKFGDNQYLKDVVKNINVWPPRSPKL